MKYAMKPIVTLPLRAFFTLVATMDTIHMPQSSNSTFTRDTNLGHTPVSVVHTTNHSSDVFSIDKSTSTTPVKIGVTGEDLVSVVEYLSNRKVLLKLPGTSERYQNPQAYFTKKYISENLEIQIQIPKGYDALLSFPYWHQKSCASGVLEIWEFFDADFSYDKKRSWSVCGKVDKDWTLLISDAEELNFEFLMDILFKFPNVYTIVLAVSIHKKSDPRLQVVDGLWNCSVPHWPEFDVHFRCNMEVDCLGAEDEEDCPYSGHCGFGRLNIDGRCYELVFREETMSWFEAQWDCQSRGGQLVTFNTRREFEHVVHAMSTRRGRLDNWLVGLHTAPFNLPDYYNRVMVSPDKTINLFLRSYEEPANKRMFCTYYDNAHNNKLRWFSPCTKQLDMDYLCELDGGAKTTAARESEAITLPEPRNTTTSLPLAECPSRHFTFRFLACDPFAACWGLVREVYLSATGDLAGTPSRSSCPFPLSPLPPMFTCREVAVVVAYSLLCDDRPDCIDGSDEDFCQYPPCDPQDFATCASSGKCIPKSALCDGQKDCHKGSDESFCDFRHFVRKRSPEIVSTTPVLIDFDAKDPQFNNIVAKQLEEDSDCPETHFLCAEDGYCLPVYVRCNGVYDCPNHLDEKGCASYTCPGFYRCRGSLECVHLSHVCDGLHQCPQRDDEFFCRLHCPRGCTCYGLAYICRDSLQAELYPEVRYLDAAHSDMSPHLLAANPMLVFLSLAHCRVELLSDLTFGNLHVLDVSHNQIRFLKAEQFQSLGNLRTLNVRNNPLVSDDFFADVLSGLIFPSLTVLDLSASKVKEVNSTMFEKFPNLQQLNLSHSSVVKIAAGGFSLLSNLRLLDLRGCHVTDFPSDVFQGLHQLQDVFADNYKLCCAVTLPSHFFLENCRAPVDEISSCESLLRSNMYRVILSMFTILSLVGNLTSFLARVVWFGSTKAGFTVLVSHLSWSDFMMGVYLTVIGIADRVYLGSYLWKDVEWRHSLACTLAGFASLLSSEMSAIVICLITLDRFLVLRFPFSKRRMNRTSATVLCLFSWLGCGVLAAVPLLGNNRAWNFYGQTGICIPLPVTRNSFEGKDYAFGIIIIFNFALFVLIASGQAAIYTSILANKMSMDSSTCKSRDLKIARRLITIAVSDFVCWFPIGLLGLLASRGVAVPGEVNVAMGIIVLPLNSALNPFLYSINVILEKRRRAKEARLMAKVKAQDGHSR